MSKAKVSRKRSFLVVLDIVCVNLFSSCQKCLGLGLKYQSSHDTQVEDMK